MNSMNSPSNSKLSAIFPEYHLKVDCVLQIQYIGKEAPAVFFSINTILYNSDNN